MVEERFKSAGQIASETHVETIRQAGGPFVTAATRSRLPMLFIDPHLPGNPIVFANDSFLSRTGFDRSEVMGRGIEFLLGPKSDPKIVAQLNSAFNETFDRVYPEIGYYCKDGSLFWAITLISPVFSGEAIQHYFLSYLDVTERRQEEMRLRFLMNELNHRTQNTLAIVQAIARQTLRGKAPQEAVEGFEGRVIALSKAHALLGAEQWYGVDLGELVARTLEPFGFGGPSRPFAVEGASVRVPPKAALTLAMVVHELATNAVKHGSLSKAPTGLVSVTWDMAKDADGKGVLRLNWRESGGPLVAGPTRKGFGSHLIENVLAKELGGTITLDYPPEGLACTIEISIANDEWGLKNEP